MGFKDYGKIYLGGVEIVAAWRGEAQVFGGAIPAPTAPGQIDAGLWSATTGDDPGGIVLSITGLPSTGGFAITGLVYRIGTGAAQALGVGVGTYPITDLTPGAAVQVQIAAVNTVGQGAWATARTVTAGAIVIPAPTVTMAPAISGTATVGQTLTATEGTYTGAPTVTLQWLRGGVAISGATGLSYVLVTADLAASITVRATATNAGGSVQSTSAEVGPVVAAVSAQTHVIILAGQSNMVGRADWDAGTSPAALSVNQVARTGKISGGTDGQIVAWNKPLDHWDPNAGQMGLDTQFAIDYMAANPGVTLVFLPGAKGGTSFAASNEWGVGKALSTDLITRANALFTAHPEYILKGMLWHQGESDGDLANTAGKYEASLDAQFAAFRSGITRFTSSVPIVVGQMCPGAVNTARLLIQAVITATPNRVVRSSVALNTGLTDKGDSLHFNAASLRTLGSRYYTALAAANANASPVAAVPGAFSTGTDYWNATTGAAPGLIVLNILALPSASGAPITKNQWSIDGTTWTDLSSTAIGAYTLTMAAAGTSYPLRVRSVNAVGNGPASSTKTVTSGAAAATWNVTAGDGTITIVSAVASPATAAVAATASGTITLSA